MSIMHFCMELFMKMSIWCNLLGIAIFNILIIFVSFINRFMALSRLHDHGTLSWQLFSLLLVLEKSCVDASLFIYDRHDVIAYFLIYVDDIVLIENNSEFLNTCVSKFSPIVFRLKTWVLYIIFCVLKLSPLHRASSYLNIITLLIYSIGSIC